MLKRAFLAAMGLAAALLYAAGPASATPGHPLRMFYAPPTNPTFPATQTVNFGAKTPVGFGGSPLGYVNRQFLGITRFLAITSQTDASSNPVSYFQIDDRQHLVPKNGSGAYGTSWGSPNCGSPGCIIVVAEFLDAGHTIPTGAATTVTVPIIANAATAREMTSSGAAGCVSNCESASANPDGGTTWAQTGTAFSFSKSQLYTLVNAGSLCLGDTVYLRDGYFNPSNQLFRLRPPSTSTGFWTCGSGRITFISETIDNGMRANGNPQYHNGFKWGGGISVDGQLSGSAVAIPFDFTNVWCYISAAVPTNGCLSQVTTVGGPRIYNIAMEMDPASQPSCTPTVCPYMPGFTGLTGAVADHFYCLNMGKCVTSGGSATITNGFGDQQHNDFIDWAQGSNTITDNTVIDWASHSPNHPDAIQKLVTSTSCGSGCSAGSGITYPGSTIARNIIVQGNYNLMPTTPAEDPPQCLFASNKETQSVEHDDGSSFLNNFCLSITTNSLLFERFDNVTARFNGQIEALNTGAAVTTGAPVPSKFVITGTPARGGTNGAFANSTFNGYAIDGQTGTVTTTGLQSLANNTGAYGTALPNCQQARNPILLGKTRASVIHACAPANLATSLGGLVNDGTLGLSGTVNWPWTPTNNAGDECWNVVGLIYDPTKTCAQMGTTKAQ